MPTPRRRPWGQLWSAAPWDGQAKIPEPLRMPNTDAAMIETPPPRGTLSLRRQAFGRMLVTAPWSGRRPSRSTAIEQLSTEMIDFGVTPTGASDETLLLPKTTPPSHPETES
jgi:hypothetical protein